MKKSQLGFVYSKHFLLTSIISHDTPINLQKESHSYFINELFLCGLQTMPDYVYLPFKRYDRTQNLSLILLHILNVGCGGGSVVLFYLSDDANITVNVIYVINSFFFSNMSLYKYVIQRISRLVLSFRMYNARFSYCSFFSKWVSFPRVTKIIKMFEANLIMTALVKIRLKR